MSGSEGKSRQSLSSSTVRVVVLNRCWPPSRRVRPCRAEARTGTFACTFGFHRTSCVDAFAIATAVVLFEQVCEALPQDGHVSGALVLWCWQSALLARALENLLVVDCQWPCAMSKSQTCAHLWLLHSGHRSQAVDAWYSCHAWPSSGCLVSQYCRPVTCLGGPVALLWLVLRPLLNTCGRAVENFRGNMPLESACMAYATCVELCLVYAVQQTYHMYAHVCVAVRRPQRARNSQWMQPALLSAARGGRTRRQEVATDQELVRCFA